MLNRALGAGALYEITSLAPPALPLQQALHSCALSLLSLLSLLSSGPPWPCQKLRGTKYSWTASLGQTASSRAGSAFKAVVPNLGWTLEVLGDLLIILMPSPTPENLNLSVWVWNLYLKIFAGDSVQQKLRAIASNSKILQFKTACLPFSLAVDALVP